MRPKSYTVKIRRFFSEIPGIWLQVTCRYFYGRLLVNHFRNQDMVGLC